MWEALKISLVTLLVTFGVLTLLVGLLVLVSQTGGEPDPEEQE